MESTADAKKDTQIAQIVQVGTKNSIFTKQFCNSCLNNDDFSLVPQYEYMEVGRGNPITTEFFQQDEILLPYDETVDFEVAQVVITGFPLENRLDLCGNGVFNHQITRCLPRQSESDETIFDLTKKHGKMIGNFRKVTQSTKGLKISKIDKLSISAPHSFKVKKTCYVEYVGFNREIRKFQFVPFNRFFLPLTPFWLDPRLIENVEVWSDKEFPIAISINGLIIHNNQSRYDIHRGVHIFSFEFLIPPDSKFSVKSRNSLSSELVTNLIHHEKNIINIIVPCTQFREKLFISTKSFKIVSWSEGRNCYKQFFI